MGYWMDNAIENGKHILLDMGYVKAQSTRDRADEIFAIISKSNAELVGFGRLLIHIPPTKAKIIMAKFPIKTAKERAGYAWCTHTWIEDDSDDFKYSY